MKSIVWKRRMKASYVKRRMKNVVWKASYESGIWKATNKYISIVMHTSILNEPSFPVETLRPLRIKLKIIFIVYHFLTCASGRLCLFDIRNICGVLLKRKYASAALLKFCSRVCKLLSSRLVAVSLLNKRTSDVYLWNNVIDVRKFTLYLYRRTI